MNAGFTANSFLFVRSDSESTLTSLQRRKLRREQKPIEWRAEFRRVRDLVYCSLSTPRFDLIDNADFLEYKHATDLALAKTEKLLSLLSMNRRRVHLKKYTIVALGYWRKMLRYQQRDFECRAKKLSL
jgi:phytoene dehydrogenase-like protein